MHWLKQKIHPVWQVTVCCLGVLCGVAAAYWVHGVTSWAVAVVAVAMIAICIWIHRRWLLVIACCAGILLGLWRRSVSQQALAVFSPMYGQHVQIEGVIREDPEMNKRNQMVLHVGSLQQGDKSLAGELWVTVANQRQVQRSDHVVIDGVLSPGFGSFVASMNSAQLVRATREQPGDIALTVRDSFSSHVDAAVKNPAASLGEGFLLGQKRGLPNDLIEALKITGLTHIIVASGYNLTILVRLTRRLFEKVSKFLSAFVSVLMIGGFVSITGLSPSMTRAGLVSLLALWAWYYGRAFHPIVLLTLAAAVTVMVHPGYLWGDLGWALSFAAFGGVMIVAPLLHAYFYGPEKPHTVAQILIETIAAQLATAPIILLAFGQFSNIAPIANLLIVPFIPLAMVLVCIAGVGAYIFPAALAMIIGWPAQTLLDTMITVIRWCANVGWAQASYDVAWWGVVLWYGVLIAACLYMWRVTGYRLASTSIVE